MDDFLRLYPIDNRFSNKIIVETRCFASSPRQGYIWNLPLTLDFESGFTGFPGLQRTSSFLAQCLFVEDYFISFFSPMRNASARGLVMKALFNDNISPQTGDVIVNPRHPEKSWFKQLAATSIISTQEWVHIIEGLAFFRDGCCPFRAYWLYSPFFIAYKLPRILQCIFLKYQIQDLRDRLLVKI